MQHIPVVSHVLWRGTFILKMLDVVPTLQTTGSYHQQDVVYLQWGGSLADQGVEGGKWVGHGLGYSMDLNGGQILNLRHLHLSRVVASAGNSCAWLCWPLPGSVHWTKFWRWVGQQWLYIQWLEPRSFSHSSGVNSTSVPLTAPSPRPLTWPSTCPFSCSWIEAGAWQTDGRQRKDFIFCSNSSSMLLSLPKKNKNKTCVTSRRFFSTSG